MGFVPLLIDSSAEYARQDGDVPSVLSLPLGAGTVIGHALKCLVEVRPLNVVVVTPPNVAARIPAAVGSACIRAVDCDQLNRVIDDFDSSLCFLVLDTRSWPLTWPSLAELTETGREYRGATHAIAIGTRLDRAAERIECNEQGQVRRIHRLYATANWPDVAGNSIAWSLVPVRSLVGIRFDSLGMLRQELAARGVLSRDKPVSLDVMNLAHAQAYLALSERVVSMRLSGKTAIGYRSGGDGTWLSRDCRVAESARLVGPVFIADGAVVGEKAMVVGPAVIGAASQVQDDAVVAQSVVLPGAVVKAGEVIRHQVYSGQRAPSSDEEKDTGESSGRTAATLDALSIPPELHRYVHCGKRRFSTVVKRLVDMTVAGSALVVLWPLLLVISILVKLDSPGPVLFGHVRERRGGREFRCFKFRTMVQDADARQRELSKENVVDGPQFKIADDPRVTRIGRWLRATNLDELPQLFNVLVGHMSLVGPRPSPFRENQICVAWRQARLSVRPGITGLWQICRATDRSQGDFHEWIYYDMAYVRHFSLWLDFKILVATVITLGGHRHVPISWLVSGLRGGRPRSPQEAAV